MVAMLTALCHYFQSLNSPKVFNVVSHCNQPPVCSLKITLHYMKVPSCWHSHSKVGIVQTRYIYSESDRCTFLSHLLSCWCYNIFYLSLPCVPILRCAHTDFSSQKKQPEKSIAQFCSYIGRNTWTLLYILNASLQTFAPPRDWAIQVEFSENVSVATSEDDLNIGT